MNVPVIIFEEHSMSTLGSQSTLPVYTILVFDLFPKIRLLNLFFIQKGDVQFDIHFVIERFHMAEHIGFQYASSQHAKKKPNLARGGPSLSTESVVKVVILFYFHCPFPLWHHLITEPLYT